MSGGKLEVASKGYLSSSGTGGQVINGGTLTVSTTPNTVLHVNVPTTSSGLINITSGSGLDLSYGSTISGRIHVEHGALLLLSGSSTAVLQQTSSVTGNGTVETAVATIIQTKDVIGIRLRVRATLSVYTPMSIRSLELVSGTFRCLANVNVTTTMEWTSGHLYSGPNKLTVLGELNMRSSLGLTNGHLVIANQAYTFPSISTLTISTSGLSTITTAVGATWDMSQMYIFDIYPMVINNGTLISSSKNYVRLRGGLINAGEFSVVRNTLSIYHGGATALNSSRITVHENAVMLFYTTRQSSTFDVMSNFTNNGQVTLYRSRLDIKSKFMKGYGRLEVKSSTLKIRDTVQLQLVNSLTVLSSQVVIDSDETTANVTFDSTTSIRTLYISSGSSVTLGGGKTVDYCSLSGRLYIGTQGGNSDKTVVNVGVLEWFSGTILRNGQSGKPQLRVRQLNHIGAYRSTMYYLRAVQLVLLKTYWQADKYVKYVYFQESDVIIPLGYHVEISFQGYNIWAFQSSQTRSRVIAYGNASFTSAREGGGCSILIPLEVHGDLNVDKLFSLSFGGASYVTGNLRSNGGNLILFSGVHAWTSTSLVDGFSEIRVRGRADLSLNSSSINILLLSVMDSTKAFVTVGGNKNVSISFGAIRLAYGVFQCSQNCIIDSAIYWGGGTIRTTHNNASVIAGPNCIVTTTRDAYNYVGPGRLVIQGRLTSKHQALFLLNDQLIIDSRGRADVYLPTSMLSRNSKGSLVVDGGTVKVHHGAQWTVNAPFYNDGKTIVEGFMRLNGYSNSMGYHRGVLSLPVPYGTFAINGNKGVFALTSKSSITGEGVIRQESGVLLVNIDLNSATSFGGTVYLVGGIIEIPAASAVNISLVKISSGTLKLNNTGHCHVDTLYHTGGTLLASGAGRFTIGEMTARSAIIEGTQDIRVTRSMIWDGSVTVTGPGLHLYIDGSMVTSKRSRNTIEIGAEVIIVTNNAIHQSSFYVSGVFRIARGGILRMQPDSSFIYSGKVGSLVNDGQLDIEALDDTHYVQLNLYVDNKGLIRMRTGKLWVRGYAGQISGGLGGVIRGSRETILHVGGSTTFSQNAFLELGDATLRIDAPTYIYSNSSPVTVSQLQVYGGTLYVFATLGLKVLEDMTVQSTVAVGTTLEVRRIFLNSGYLTRRSPNATLLVKELQWRSGTIQSTPYTLTDFWLTVSHLLSMSSGSYYVDGCGILSTGTTTMPVRGSLELRYQSIFRNEGNMTIDRTGSSIINSGRLINSGDLQIDVGISGSVDIPINLINYGHIRVVTGRLNLYGTNYYCRHSTVTVVEEAVLQFSGGTHRFTAGSVVDVRQTASIVVSSGTVEFLPNSTATQFYHLTVSGGYFTVHRRSNVSKIDMLTNPSSGGSITLNNTIVVGKAVLSGGTTTVGGRIKVNQLLTSADMILQGGRQQERAILQVDGFTYTGGKIRTWSSTGHYFIISVSHSMLVDNFYDPYRKGALHYLERCDLVNYGTATAALLSPLSIQNRGRLINAASGRMILKYASFEGSGTLVNYGYMSVGSSNAINLNVRLVLAGGTVRVDNKELILQNGGFCNHSGITVDVAEGSEIQIRRGTFQCRPQVIKGRGTVRVNGGTLQLTSGELVQYIEINSGSVFIPALQNVQFSNNVRLIGGSVNVDGKANFTRRLDFEAGSMRGNGVLVISNQAALLTTGYTFNSRFVFLQIQNYGLMELITRIYFYRVGRNEKTGTTQMTSTTEIYGSGGIDNIGHLICTAHFGSRCYVATPFRNYRHLELESGDLILSSRAQLYDGCRVSGSGRLVANSLLYVAGMSYASIVAGNGVYITSPFFSYGSFVWSSGSMLTTVDGCASSYSASNPYLNPLCEEAYFMNEGSMTISGSSYKALSSESLFINKGQLMWSAYGTFDLYGTFVNTKRGVCTFYRTRLSSRSSSGNITNYGTFNVNWTNVYMYGITFENYGSFNLKQSSAYFNYEIFTQDGSNSTLQLVSGILRVSSLQLRNGVLRGYGTVQGPVNNIAGTVEPILPDDATPTQLTVSSMYFQHSTGNIKIRLRKREKSVVSGTLAVQGATLDGSLYVTWDGREVTDNDVKAGSLPAFITYKTRIGNFSAVYETGNGLLSPQIGVSFDSTHGVLKPI
jgi:hypothetical protein